MTLRFACKKCGKVAPDLSEHDCKPTAAQLLAMLDEAHPALGPAVFKEAAVTGRAFVRGQKMLKAEEVLSPSPAKAKRPGFDRAAYQKVYMREYMRAWRARKKDGA
jgi:hypothetical protein